MKSKVVDLTGIWKYGETPDQMLVLYELNNFAADTSVVKLAL